MNRINIIDKRECCGCAACADGCPKSCIKMEQDVDGFVYPVIDIEKCVSCGKCKSVCPILGSNAAKNETNDKNAYAYVSFDNESVYSSSSGGAFSLIMNAVLDSGDEYAIVGAGIEGTRVQHIIVRDETKLKVLRKSKYVQSQTEGIFKNVELLLKQNIQVLFSGTPCQVAALKCYLGREYDNLLTVDIVCHGVPNQTVFDEYIKEVESKYGLDVTSVQFRQKLNFNTQKPNPRTLNIVFANKTNIDLTISESEYLYAYYTGLLYRPSCINCKFACSSRTGDITLGDYWGIEKIHSELSSLRGVSLVRFNTDKGKYLMDWFKKSGIFIETDWTYACSENNQLTHPAVPHRNRDKFFKLRLKGIGFCESVQICKKPDSFLQKVFRKTGTLLGKKI